MPITSFRVTQGGTSSGEFSLKDSSSWVKKLNGSSASQAFTIFYVDKVLRGTLHSAATSFLGMPRSIVLRASYLALSVLVDNFLFFVPDIVWLALVHKIKGANHRQLTPFPSPFVTLKCSERALKFQCITGGIKDLQLIC